MGFPRQEYWSGLSFPPPGDLPDPGIKPASPVSPALQADSLPLSHLGMRSGGCFGQVRVNNSGWNLESIYYVLHTIPKVLHDLIFYVMTDTTLAQSS